MKTKIFLFILLFVLIAPVAVGQSMTDAQRQALIAQIQAQIAALQEQINRGNVQGATGWCHSFNVNLGFVNSGTSEVSDLHTVLQKENISYSPDATTSYSTATAEAVKKFQAKYGILQTGYVGPLTRAKLNQLYGCQSTSTNTPTNTPTNTQTNTTPKPTKPIDIKVENADGPVNLFVTLNNGAVVGSSGIVLSKKIELKWVGGSVASCSASDSVKPSVFSGYKTASGSQTVTLSGIIQPTASSTSKVSGIFRINCVSTSSGLNVSDSVTVNLFYTVNSSCSPNWQCTNWSACNVSRQTRTCVDNSGCGSLEGKPLESQSCANPPTVNIKANNSDGPVSVANGSTANLSWTSTNSSLCTASADWSGTKAKSGSERTGRITTSKTYIITCVNSAGAEAIDRVTVNPANP